MKIFDKNMIICSILLTAIANIACASLPPGSLNVPCTNDPTANGNALVNIINQANNMHPGPNFGINIKMGACDYKLPDDLTISPFINFYGAGQGGQPIVDAQNYLDPNHLYYGVTTIDTDGHTLTLESPTIVGMAIINSNAQSSTTPVILNNVYYSVELSDVSVLNYGAGNTITIENNPKYTIFFNPDLLMVYTSRAGSDAIKVTQNVNGRLQLTRSIISAPNSNPTGIELDTNTTQLEIDGSDIYGGSENLNNAANFTINSSELTQVPHGATCNYDTDFDNHPINCE